MKRASWILAATLGLGGCLGSTGPSDATVWVLHRFGDATLPARAFQAEFGPLVLADTLIIPNDVASPAGGILTHIRIWLNGNQPPTREVRRLQASRRDDALLVNECPVGSACIAIIELSSAFVVVGDSLFEQVSAGSLRRPRVYGVVRESPRRGR